jgi:hypothetical protein
MLIVSYDLAVDSASLLGPFPSATVTGYSITACLKRRSTCLARHSNHFNRYGCYPALCSINQVPLDVLLLKAAFYAVVLDGACGLAPCLNVF